MTVYIVAYLLAVFFSYFYSVEKNEKIAFFLKISLFLTLFLPLAFRYNIGTDYKNYYELINFDVNIQKGNWSSFELGWYPLIWCIKKFNLDIQIFFIITAFFSVFFILKIIDKKAAFYCTILYISTLYLDSFSLIRQAFAAILSVYGLNLYLKTDKKKYLLWTFISIFFHRSIIVLIIILPIFIKLNRKNAFTSTTWIFIFIISFIFFSLINIPAILFRYLTSSIFGTYSRYFTDSLYGKQTKLGTGLGVLLKEMGIVPFLFFMSKTKINGQKNTLYASSNLFLLLILISYIFSTQITIMNRIPYIFTTYYLIATKSLYESKNKYRKIGLYFLFFIFTTMYIVNLTRNPSSANTGLGITPYQSIFSR